jgi:hypothetical protein
MQQLSFCRVFLFGFLVLSGYLINSSGPAESSGIAPPIDYKTSGIRFKIAASIKADSASMHYYDQANASLAVRIRISAHARESQFFGEVSKVFPDFPVNDGSTEMLFWQDARCHQRRGLPKTTVVGVDGSIAGESGKINVHARPRQLGVPLPLDEITQGLRLSDGFDQNNAFIAYRSQSKLSNLLIDVKIYTFNCALGGK